MTLHASPTPAAQLTSFLDATYSIHACVCEKVIWVFVAHIRVFASFDSIWIYDVCTHNMFMLLSICTRISYTRFHSCWHCTHLWPIKTPQSYLHVSKVAVCLKQHHARKLVVCVCLCVCVCSMCLWYVYVYVYLYVLCTHTHTHTHIYIYNVYVFVFCVMWYMLYVMRMCYVLYVLCDICYVLCDIARTVYTCMHK
jgi:hypothetical protein